MTTPADVRAGRLLNAIAGAARNYCATKKHTVGFFHGTTGRYRATNAFALAAMLIKEHQHKLAILALAWALFKPAKRFSWGQRGAGFCHILAHTLLRGTYHYVHTVKDGECKITGKLQSDYFDSTQINATSTMFEAYDITCDIGFATYGLLNHDRAVTMLLKEEIEKNVTSKQQTNFNKLVSLFRKTLHHQPDDKRINISTFELLLRKL